jgi:hypothetical protein
MKNETGKPDFRSSYKFKALAVKPAANCQLPATSEGKPKNKISEAATCLKHLQLSQLPAANSQLPIANSQLPIASC